MDYDINETTRLFVRYSRNALQEERSFHYSTNSAINPADTGKNNPFTRENHNATIQFTKTFSPTMVLDIRAGLERFKSESGAQQGAGVGPSTLGFSSTFVVAGGELVSQSSTGPTTRARARSRLIPVRSRKPTRSQAALAKVDRPRQHKIRRGVPADSRLFAEPGFNAGNFTFDQTLYRREPAA